MKRKKKINKNIILIISLIIVIALIVIGGVILTGYSIFKTNNRPSHCVDGTCLDPIIFSRLPPYPENFDEIVIGVTYGKYKWNEHFSPKAPDEYYYKQPEFYPGFDQEENLEYYLSVKDVGGGQVSRTTERFGVIGYGIYPGDTIVSNIHPGEDLKVVTYLHASWFVGKYQGMELKEVFPNRGEVKITKDQFISILQDPNEVKNYFTINIDPTLILLGPAFPIFQPNWVQKITVKVHVNENTPPGTYLVGVTPFTPPEDMSSEWTYKYGIFMYKDAGMAEIGRPHLQIFVEVV